MSCIAYKKRKGENIEPLLQKARKRRFRINNIRESFSLYILFIEKLICS